MTGNPTPIQVAADLLRVPASNLSAIRIKGGLTNASWSVEGPGSGSGAAVVVRISTADEQALQLNRRSEMQVLSLVQQADIGAEVLLCAPERRLLVTRKLDARNLDRTELSQSTCMQQLAALLRRLHSLAIPDGVQHTDLSTVLYGYWVSLENTGVAIPLVQRERALAIAAESALVTPRCLCHNDVHHLNLMSNGERLWLLDWEYAGIGDPLFDLASVCCSHDFSIEESDAFLTAYRGELTKAESERLQRMCWLFEYIRELWMQVRGSDPPLLK